ncbi:P-type ATPase [Svornostia abyssi]|uniref:P-type ATPase n=1 Tax=Svornostia abyssi TaxID=2898438 RepID=UPI00338F4D1F
MFLYSLAEAIEELAFARTRSAIRDLLDLAPKQARRLVDGREQEVPAEQLAVGDVFVVRPGEALPTDGVPVCCCGRWTARRSRERAALVIDVVSLVLALRCPDGAAAAADQVVGLSRCQRPPRLVGVARRRFVRGRARPRAGGADPGARRHRHAGGRTDLRRRGAGCGDLTRRIALSVAAPRAMERRGGSASTPTSERTS